MNKDIADRWVAALRSGEYKQTQKTLRRLDNSYCCLGVLCEILETPCEARTRTYAYDDSVDFLPNSVRIAAGMNSTIGQYHKDGYGFDLATTNDDGASFAEIANIIEKHWEQL